MKSCFTCKHRSEDEKNQWNQMPAYKCTNKNSFKHGRLVLKGQSCVHFEIDDQSNVEAAWEQQVQWNYSQ